MNTNFNYVNYLWDDKKAEALGDVPTSKKGINNRPLGWIYDSRTLVSMPIN